MVEKDLKDEAGRVPGIEILKNFASEHGWRARKDALEAEASAQMDIILVEETVSMWKQHAEAAREVALKALDYIRQEGFDSSSSAISAIKWAQEEERKTRGADAFITTIKNKSSQDLLEAVRELMERSAETEDIVDMETKEEEK